MPVNALHTAKALDLMGRKEPPMAMCRRCPNEPVVSTFEMPGAEFHCVVCGEWIGFLDPRPEPATPELEARLEEHKATYAAQRAEREGQAVRRTRYVDAETLQPSVENAMAILTGAITPVREEDIVDG
jgi:hypothetical protein